VDGIKTKNLDNIELARLIIGPPGTIFYEKNIKRTIKKDNTVLSAFRIVQKKKSICSPVQPLIFPNIFDPLLFLFLFLWCCADSVVRLVFNRNFKDPENSEWMKNTFSVDIVRKTRPGTSSASSSRPLTSCSDGSHAGGYMPESLKPAAAAAAASSSSSSSKVSAERSWAPLEKLHDTCSVATHIPKARGAVYI
jgi:hypothetical protein